MSYETRESWLRAAADRMWTELLAPLTGTKQPVWEVSCGWPSRRATSSNRRIGECWYPIHCADKSTHHLFISPALDNPLDVLDTLIHELVHAVVGPGVGHRGAFRRLAKAVGLEGKMTATYAGDALKVRLVEMVIGLGQYPHAALNAVAKHKVQSTRLLRLVCSNCGYVIRTTAKWLAAGVPTCHCGTPFRR